MERIATPFLILSLAFLITACGVEDRSQTTASSTPEVTIALAGMVSGAPGELTFNRQPLHTGSALVTAQGKPTTAAKIRPGSVIRGTATKTGQGYLLQCAEVHHEVEGLIERVDRATSRLVVMGQTVRVDAFTGIGEEGPGETCTSLRLADLKAGDRIEVDGSQAPDGLVQATRIEQVPTSPSPEGSYHGVLAALNTGARTAQAGGCTVSFGKALVTGPLSNGARVEVHGTLSGRMILATSVKVETGLEDLTGSSLEVCGPISGFDPVAKTFMLMSYKVDYSRAKVVGTLLEGARVVAEGPLLTNGEATAAFSDVKVGARIELRVLSARADPRSESGGQPEPRRSSS